MTMPLRSWKSKVVLSASFFAGIISLLTDSMARDDPAVPMMVVFAGAAVLRQWSAVLTVPLAFIGGFISFVPLAIAAALIESQFELTQDTIGVLGFVIIFGLPALVILSAAAAVGVAFGRALAFVVSRVRPRARS